MAYLHFKTVIAMYRNRMHQQVYQESLIESPLWFNQLKRVIVIVYLLSSPRHHQNGVCMEHKSTLR